MNSDTDRQGAKWELMSRRRLLSVAGTVAGASAGALALGTLGVQRGAAAALTAANVDITSDDGTVTSLTVEPDITVTWTGLDTAPTSVELALTVSTGARAGFFDSDPSHTFTAEVETPETSATTNDAGDTFDMNVYSILANNPFPNTYFDSGTDGDDVVRDVQVQVDVTLKNGGETLATATAGPSSYAVTVTNLAASATASGVANTAGS